MTLDSTAAAALLKCSVAHLHRLARAGLLPTAKVGRGWVFIQDDLLSWLRDRQQAPVPKAAAPRGRPRKRQPSHF